MTYEILELDVDEILEVNFLARSTPGETSGIEVIFKTVRPEFIRVRNCQRPALSSITGRHRKLCVVRFALSVKLSYA